MAILRIGRAPGLTKVFLLLLGAVFAGLSLGAQQAAPPNTEDELFSPEHTMLFAVPGSVRQVNGKFPATVPMLLSLKNCTSGEGFADGGIVTLTAAAPGIAVATPVVHGCQLTTTLTLDPTTVLPGYVLLNVAEQRPAKPASNGKPAVAAELRDWGNAMLTLFDSAAGPVPGYPQVDVMWASRRKSFAPTALACT